MRNAWEVVVGLRPTIFVAAMAFVLLSLPSQILELYLIDIDTVKDALAGQGGQAPNSWQVLVAIQPILAAMVAGSLAMVMLWITSVHLVALDPTRPEWPRKYLVLAHVLVLLIVLAPMLGVLGGLNGIRTQLEQIAPGNVGELRPAVVTYMIWTGGLILVAAIVIALINAFWLEPVAAAARRLYTRTGAIAGVALIAVFTVAITLWPLPIASALGSQGLIYLFFAALAFVLTGFSHIYRVTGYPVTVIVLLAAVVISWLDRSDNHQIDYTVATNAPPALEESFTTWFKERKDRAHFAQNSKPYPVYIISAEGGGMYAGYHVASFLARLQDSCPNFAQHVFGISSVSGGSVGGALFAALATHSARNTEWQGCSDKKDGEFQRATREYFANDFLSPLIAATLFPDALQRVIPFPIKALDRARAIEEAFADAWIDPAGGSRTARANPFRQSVHGMWRPDGATPALFLNTTSVETGGRVTLGPVFFETTPTAVHLSSNLCKNIRKGIDFPLATAASLSARFPLLTPAGWIDISKAWETACDADMTEREFALKGNRRKMYLADGGYFENSGLETAADLVKRLRALVKAQPDAFPGGVDIRIIMVFALDEVAQRFWSAYPDLAETGPGEIMAPIKALLNTRVARTRSVQAREIVFDEDMKPRRVKGASLRGRTTVVQGKGVLMGSDDIHQVALDGTRFFLPLGWRLSKGSMKNIEDNPAVDSQATFTGIMRELSGESGVPGRSASAN